MQYEHTVRAFDVDLHGLRRNVAAIGELTERKITEAVSAVSNPESQSRPLITAKAVCVAALRSETEHMASLTLVRRQPMAIDLRETIGVLNICHEYADISDLIAKVAQLASMLSHIPCPQDLRRATTQLGSLVIEQLSNVVQSYSARDETTVRAICDDEKELDATYQELSARLHSHAQKHSADAPAAMHLLLCADHLEHIGNHVVKIAEEIHYIENGCKLGPLKP